MKNMGSLMGGFAIPDDYIHISGSGGSACSHGPPPPTRSSGGSGCSHGQIIRPPPSTLTPTSSTLTPTSTLSMADLPIEPPKSSTGWLSRLFLWLAIGAIVAAKVVLPRASVLMLQVAFDGSIDQIKRDLELISTAMDSRTRRGLHSLLSKTVSCTYRYPKSCFSANSKKKVKAFVSVNDCGDRTRCDGAICPNNKYLIVTILVAAVGIHELPAINSYSDLDKALYVLTCIPHQYIEAVKVFWTFHDDIEDLSSLRQLRSGC